MEPDEPTRCRFRGKEMDIADARMILSKDELPEVEVTMADGSVVRPFRFCEVDPEVTVDEHGGLHL
jgi:hypothetical protein